MFKQIYVPVDNSPLSNEAATLATRIGAKSDSRLIGSHVYAAKLHDQRFRTMESGLPSQYHEERELDKQRKIHDSLITKGLELITDSYLKSMAAQCDKENLKFSGVSLEGKNWLELTRDINDHAYDLVVIGAFGLGRVSGSVIGSVTERVARRIDKDLLVVRKKEAENTSDKIVVCLDGSDRSYGALKTAIYLAKQFNKKVEAISAFDPYYHYVMFDSLNDVLTDSAREVFKFEEQEKLHEDIIDSGLAKVYQANLDISARIAEDDGMKIKTRLLDGKAWEKILEYISADPPWLLLLGRTGIHNEDDIDIGNNAENILRLAPCNLMLTATKFRPPIEYQADETIVWTQEARARMEMVPAMAKGVAMKGIQQHAVAEGHTMITSDVVDDAIRKLLPPESIKAMGIVFDDDNKNRTYDTFSLSYECPDCAYIHHDARPKKCPVCGAAGETFHIVDTKKAATQTDDDAGAETTFDGRKLIWTPDAKTAFDAIDDDVLRRQVRAKVEKNAFVKRQTTITADMITQAKGTDVAKDQLQWTDEAANRLSRVPEGFMRASAKKSIEAYASEHSLTVIDLASAEAGLGKARNKMAEAMKSAPSTMGHASHASHHIGAQTPPPHDTLTDMTQTEREKSFQCAICGLVADKLKPLHCASCGSHEFSALSEKERANLPPAALVMLKWDERATARLNRTPKGFMREMTKNRIEHWARSRNHKIITEQLIEEKYASWEMGARGVESSLEWDANAKARIEKIPDFVRPMIVKEVENYVKADNKTKVDEQTLDSIVNKWGNDPDFHRK